MRPNSSNDTVRGICAYTAALLSTVLSGWAKPGTGIFRFRLIRNTHTAVHKKPLSLPTTIHNSLAVSSNSVSVPITGIAWQPAINSCVDTQKPWHYLLQIIGDTIMMGCRKL